MSASATTGSGSGQNAAARRRASGSARHSAGRARPAGRVLHRHDDDVLRHRLVGSVERGHCPRYVLFLHATDSDGVDGCLEGVVRVVHLDLEDGTTVLLIELLFNSRFFCLIETDSFN